MEREKKEKKKNIVDKIEGELEWERTKKKMRKILEFSSAQSECCVKWEDFSFVKRPCDSLNASWI